MRVCSVVFFFQAEDGIRDGHVTGVQTCALPISASNVHEGEEVLPNDRVILITDKVKMPNVIGWSSRDIMQLANLLDLEITIEGNGFVESQSIAADKPIKKGDSLTVELSSPTKVEPKRSEERRVGK